MTVDRGLLQRRLDQAASRDEAVIAVLCTYVEGDEIAVSSTVSGSGEQCAPLFMAEALMRVMRNDGLSVGHRCRLDYLRREIMRLVEEIEDVSLTAPDDRPKLCLVD